MNPDTGHEAAPRHAVYFAPPPQHPLWALGCAWLGRDPADGPPRAGPPQPLVAEPWRYGFHATLKAPMRLADGVPESQWLAAVRALARRHEPFAMPPLRVGMLSGFISLRLAEPLQARHPLRRLADDCVQALDRWRAPLSGPERIRQLQPSLSARQRENVERHGYAHVLDDWRFHMSLSNPLAGIDSERIVALHGAAERHFAPALALPLACDALCVFVEPAAGQAFELRHRFALGAA